MAVNSSTSSSKGFKDFAVRSVVGLALLALADLAVGQGLRYFYLRQKSGEDFNTTYVLEKANQEIVIMGDSRATHHYDARLIEQLTEHTCHNAGRAAQSLVYTEVIQELLLKRHRPKLLILDLNPVGLLEQSDDQHKLSSLLPYASTFPEIAELMKQRSPFETWRMRSAIYPYNSKILQIAKANVAEESSAKGFIPLYGQVKPTESERSTSRGRISAVKEAALHDFARRCQELNIPLVAVVSPIYDWVGDRSVIRRSREILAQYNATTWDYLDQASFSTQAAKFSDRDHLNKRGAAEFSALIAERLTSDELLPRALGEQKQHQRPDVQTP